MAESDGLSIGIYRGFIVKYILVSPQVACFTLDGEEFSIGIDHIVQVPEEEYRKVESEMKATRDEIDSLTKRIIRLEGEYQAKKEALRELMTVARGKEFSITSRLAKAFTVRKEWE